MAKAETEAPARDRITPLLTLAECRRQTGVVVPFFFRPSVPESMIRTLVDRVLTDSGIYCDPSNLVTVVDRGSVVERVLEEYPGLRVHVLPRNRAKAGAVAAGLRALLETTGAQALVTRDGDADHSLEDLPRLVSRLQEMREADGEGPAFVMGGRISLEKPMGWVRDQWELLTNRILTDLTAFRLAQSGRVIDRRFWGGSPPDIQSGYRAYSRQGAELAVKCLDEVPEDRKILTFACEFVPFTEILAAGGQAGQVLRSTLVEQPVSSYATTDYASAYGHLLVYMAERFGVSREILARITSNYAGDLSLQYTDYRADLQRFLDLVGTGPVRGPGFV